MEATCLLRSMATQFQVEDNKETHIRSAVRMRPIVRQIQRKHVIPYILSIAEKHIFNIAGDSVSAISILTPVWQMLMERLKKDKKEIFDFNVLHSISMECLRSAVKLCTEVNSTPVSSNNYRTWSSLGLCVDAVSVINRRRRQEDRWFATSDLLSYASACVADENKPSRCKSSLLPPVSAVAVFDGHNGPEAAEHSSHLAPYLLSLGLMQGASGRVPAITDLLANLFFELNLSVNEGHRNNVWSSGTTATICVVHGDCISTAWVGDSQAWLVYMPNCQSTERSTHATAEFRKSEPPQLTSPNGCQISRAHSALVNGESSQNSSSTPLKDQKQKHSISSNHNFADTNVPAVALTDSLHRPEFANEFVSVLRTGGLVSTVVDPEDGRTQATTTTFLSGVAMPPEKSCYNNIVLPSADLKMLQLPPLNDPNLCDCRVGGLSCVSRAIGDDYMLQGVSGLPSITTWKCSKEPDKQPLCLVVASDGLWDTENCSPSEVACIAQHWFQDHRQQDGSIEKGLSRELTQLAVSNGASDNVTCLVLWLHRWKPQAWTANNQPNLGKNVRWPRGTRITSLVDFNSPKQTVARGPNYLKPFVPQQRSSMYEGTVFQNGVRYSSPPRHKS